MDGSFWVQGTGGSGEDFADVWINEKNFEAELVQPRRRITAQDMCDGVGKKKTCILADLLYDSRARAFVPFLRKSPPPAKTKQARNQRQGSFLTKTKYIGGLN
jgi:hypothetical protein